jgi:hypothetical protein
LKDFEKAADPGVTMSAQGDVVSLGKNVNAHASLALATIKGDRPL